MKSSILLIFLCCHLQLARVEGNLNYTGCALKAIDAHERVPNSSFLVDAEGKLTNNLRLAQGVTYGWCAQNCGSSDNYNDYNWAFFSQGILSWLVPWLALTVQLPFATRSKAMSLWVLCLAIGSPSLVTYTLSLTLLNSRSINNSFRRLRASNKHEHASHRMEMIEALRILLTECQGIPIQIYNGTRREFAQLIVKPENIPWWSELRRELLKSKKGSFGLYTQIG